MDFLTDRFYSFSSKALDADTFAVVSFTGEEGLGQCYRFDIELMTDNAEIDMDGVLRNGATFTIHRNEGDDVQFHGILSDFEQQHAAGEVVFYRAVLVPRLWRLGLSHHNQVFLDMTVREMVELVLKDGGLTANDYEFKLQADYAKQRYVCQYGESHLNFISRRLEREGIYYYFDQTGSSEKIIFTDTAIAHQARAQGSELTYAPPSGLLDDHGGEVVLGLVCRQRTLPQTVRLKDYNYRKPSLEVAASATVDETASGEVYLYGEHFDSPREGERLAGIRAQELICGRQTFVGDSTVAYVSPGYTFTLDGHYRKSFNQKYLPVEITHEGSQTGFMMAGLQAALSDREKKTFYRNQFTAIAAGIQFRPPRAAQQPRITGTLNAKIDAAGSGKYAELDEHGRYKVILPFDLSGRKDGKASAWLRMAQPYAGAGHGMHFPLHKGTEVLLTFIEGNPDRPVIAAAVPNTESPSPVTAADQTMAKITTGGGNKIHIQDQEGKQRILLKTPTADTWVCLGAANDPEEPKDPKEPKDPEEPEASEASENVDEENFGEYYHEAAQEHEGYTIKTGEHYTLKTGGGKFEMIGGAEQKMVLGNIFDLIVGGEEKIMLGLERFEFFLSALDIAINIARGRLEFVTEKKEFLESKTKMHALKTELTEELTQMVGETNKVIGEATHMIGDVTKMVGENRTIIGSLCSVASEEFQAFADSVEASGQRIKAVGEEVRTTGNHVATVGESIRMAGSDTTLAGERMRVIENDVSVAGEMTEITEVSTSISALTSMI